MTDNDLMGTLYVVGTPLGNLEDISARALRVLREVQLIAAEDTRTSRTLLRAHDIRTPLTSFHEFSGPGKARHLVERLREIDIALISDAGMPGISDPGYPLIRQAIDAAGWLRAAHARVSLHGLPAPQGRAQAAPARAGGG
jgi:16S rRNA (cytidine1402-2'-O)-methyltransferase